jgi:hypothetical protein
MLTSKGSGGVHDAVKKEEKTVTPKFKRWMDGWMDGLMHFCSARNETCQKQRLERLLAFPKLKMGNTVKKRVSHPKPSSAPKTRLSGLTVEFSSIHFSSADGAPGRWRMDYAVQSRRSRIVSVPSSNGWPAQSQQSACPTGVPARPVRRRTTQGQEAGGPCIHPLRESERDSFPFSVGLETGLGCRHTSGMPACLPVCLSVCHQLAHVHCIGDHGSCSDETGARPHVSGTITSGFWVLGSGFLVFFLCGRS